MLTVVLGSFIAVGVLAYALLGGGSHSYIDFPSFFLVLGGAISASLMSITKDNFRELFSCIKTTFLGRPTNERKIKEELLLISNQAARAKHLGQLSHISTIPLINKATRLLQSEVDHNNMHKILSEVIAGDKSMAMRCSDMIRSMSKYPPAFGMIGTILGLIGLMEEISLSGGMEKIGGKMALALITTLYGLLISNYILAPLSEVILNKAQSELKIKKMILDTFVMISINRHDPVLVNEFLGADVVETASFKASEAA
ncbi:MAG: MotA/TolQ/ExbB proton channel family protein [Bacteriovoracaceae bacterium]|nr:MotA/TolQ/ExbB proton channel family protein [Bacteriovoracaceae bacterium]